MEARQVHRRRGRRQDGRRGRARPHRCAVRAADGRVRHPADRLRPLHRAGPRRAARRPAVSLDELLRESDFISIHLPKTPETVGLIGERELALCKPGVHHRQRRPRWAGRRAGAGPGAAAAGSAAPGIDVYATEPCTDSRCSAFDNVVVTPHLGASTVEAQDKAGHRCGAQRQARAARRVRARRGQRAGRRGGRRGGAARRCRSPKSSAGCSPRSPAGSPAVDGRGPRRDRAYDVSVLQLAALKGVFADVVEEPVTFVNAPLLAAERGRRGLAGQATARARSSATSSPCAARSPPATEVRSAGPSRAAAGREAHRGGRLRRRPACREHLLFLRYADRPGVVGIVGAALGDARVNIAGVQVSREEAGWRSAHGADRRQPGQR